MEQRERGFSLLELLIVVAIIVIITAVALPHLGTGRMQAQEAAAQKALNTLETVCTAYQNDYASYPHLLSDLGPSASGTPSKTAADLLDSVMAPPGGGAATKDGYTFAYVAGPADANGTINTYSITADPISWNHTGKKRFYVDQTGTVRYTMDGSPATALSPPLQ